MTEENVAPEVTDADSTEQTNIEVQETSDDVSPEDLKSKLAYLEEKKRSVDTENKNMRARLKEIDAARQAAEDSTKSTEQRLQDQLTEATTRYESLFQRIIKTEAEATATGVLNDPADALRYLDLSDFTTEDGLDRTAFQKAVKDLAKERKYLAVQQDVTSETAPSRGPRPDPTQASAANGTKNLGPEALFAATLQEALNRR